MDFSQPGGLLRIVVRLKITNRGPAITLHGIRLCSDSDPKLRLSPTHNGFDQRQLGVDHVRLESGDVRVGFLQFSGLRTNEVWVLEFQDPDNRIYRESIPTQLYKH